MPWFAHDGMSPGWIAQDEQATRSIGWKRGWRLAGQILWQRHDVDMAGPFALGIPVNSALSHRDRSNPWLTRSNLQLAAKLNDAVSR